MNVRLPLALALSLVLALPASSQAPPPPEFDRAMLFPTYAAFADSLDAVLGAGDADALDAFWADLRAANQIPFAVGDTVAFLYRGPASSVAWRGDFNGWGETPGTRLGTSDVWRLTRAMPSDARVDYKLFLNGNAWLLDPENPLEMWSGFGPNSELRMPDYVYPTETVERGFVGSGALSDNLRLTSTHLGYDVNVRVYTPPGYFALADLPVLYVTDGHEYAADYLGSLPTVLDNLLADGKIAPILVVFIDPRNPNNTSENRRGSEYVGNRRFADFVAEELVPFIDGAYRTDPAAAARGILGTSLGGLFSAYLGAIHPDVFQHIAIQSPAFWAWPEIYDLYRDTPFLAHRIYMSHGTLFDGSGGPTMEAILAAEGYTYTFRQVNEGHSWGHWRGLLDEALVYFWPAESATATESAETPSLALRAYPNPFREAATLTFTLPRPAPVRLDVFDLLGRRVTPLADAPHAAGTHTVRLAAEGWPSGVYLVRLATGGHVVTRRLVRVK